MAAAASWSHKPRAKAGVVVAEGGSHVGGGGRGAFLQLFMILFGLFSGFYLFLLKNLLLLHKKVLLRRSDLFYERWRVHKFWALQRGCVLGPPSVWPSLNSPYRLTGSPEINGRGGRQLSVLSHEGGGPSYRRCFLTPPENRWTRQNHRVPIHGGGGGVPVLMVRVHMRPVSEAPAEGNGTELKQRQKLDLLFKY